MPLQLLRARLRPIRLLVCRLPLRPRCVRAYRRPNMASSIVTAISSIVRIIGATSSNQDLVGDNASSVITTVDFQRVVQGVNAPFFTTVAFTDIQTIHSQFYRNWLPTVVNLSGGQHREITPDDIKVPAGASCHIFRALLGAREQLAQLMNGLREVLKVHLTSLHTDELLRGLLSFIHVFGLLLHIHAVVAKLRSIKIGAVSLDDRRLVTDTRSVPQYLVDGEAALSLPLRDSTLQNRRQSEITYIRPSPSDRLHPPFWYFKDDYTPRSSTTPDITLAVRLRATVAVE
ncbi:hypothetical protein BC835DRAFT_340487 [Cytidiella melzeri]|nr:hypothetical protein BC835DRAFT_340487 [Cytidiella melzeri]